MNVVHPLALRCTLYFNDGSLLVEEWFEQRAGNVFDLHLTRKECRVVSRKGVGAESVISSAYGPMYMLMHLQDGEVWEIVDV